MRTVNDMTEDEKLSAYMSYMCELDMEQIVYLSVCNLVTGLIMETISNLK